MAKATPASVSPLRAELEALAAFEPVDLPVVSLYLNLAADQHGELGCRLTITPDGVAVASDRSCAAVERRICRSS
jgi:hypothetical protein